MVSQYPYFLQVLKAPNLEAKDAMDRDENGDWVMPMSTTMIYCLISNCRNGGSNGGSNGELKFEIDGVQYVAEAVVFAPNSCPMVAIGSRIRVVQSCGFVRKEGIVKKFEKSQLHTRLWV